MSLQYIGISHFPVLHRQFSSPASTSFVEASPSQDLAQDNKDVLVERLNDLVLRLWKDSSLEDSIVSAIHTGVDQIEVLMKSREKQIEKNSPQIGGEAKILTEQPEDIFWGPRTPTRNIKMRFADSPNSPIHSIRPKQQMTAQCAIKLAKEAEGLASRLSASVAQLQVRKEESDHIHDLLVTRAEAAAERILLLEYRINELEEDLDANQSELKFLRIQLQAVEAQCAQYVPQDKDQVLSQSIMNWKIDWEDIDRRSKARRKKFRPPTASLDNSRTVLDSSIKTSVATEYHHRLESLD